MRKGLVRGLLQWIAAPRLQPRQPLSATEVGAFHGMCFGKTSLGGAVCGRGSLCAVTAIPQPSDLGHRWQTQGSRAKPGPPPCFIRPGMLFLPGGSTELSLNC